MTFEKGDVAIDTRSGFLVHIESCPTSNSSAFVVSRDGKVTSPWYYIDANLLVPLSPLIKELL